MPHVYLLTESRFLNRDDSNHHAQHVLEEDVLLSAALLDLGISSQRVNWADSSIDWSTADAAVFRTTWDYFDRFKEFESWLNLASKQVPLINPLSLLRWNMDKHYLLDLNERGFPIVPSIFIEQGEKRSLAELHASSGWDEVILKPCISGTARHTYRLDQSNIPAHESILAELLQDEAMMLQEFHESIIERGEVSHMVINGRYTHSVLKQSKGDDFRVQDSFGGTLHAYSASPSEIALAESVFASCAPSPIYGRLDIMWNNEGGQMIGELEIIEPDLWMRMHPEAAINFAQGIQRALKAQEAAS